MYPEIVLSPDEALTLFEIANGAITAMADQLAVSKTKWQGVFLTQQYGHIVK